jgi:membrane-bound metal-dependent hydrolase YbcI (DUF457 family)
MQKRNHITFGAIFVVALIFVLGWLGLNWISFSASSIFSIILITVFYSLFPDIDHKNSTITWWFFGFGVIGIVFGLLEFAYDLNFISPIKLMSLSCLLLVFTYLASTIFEHRGFIHSITAGLIAAFPLLFIFPGVVYYLIGYVAWHSHLIGDGYLLKFK